LVIAEGGRNNFALGGRITLHWVAELIAFSSSPKETSSYGAKTEGISSSFGCIECQLMSDVSWQLLERTIREVLCDAP
jgi:hypothetical protein